MMVTWAYVSGVGVGMYRVYLMSEEGLEWDDEEVVDKGELMHLP